MGSSEFCVSTERSASQRCRIRPPPSPGRTLSLSCSRNVESVLTRLIMAPKSRGSAACPDLGNEHRSLPRHPDYGKLERMNTLVAAWMWSCPPGADGCDEARTGKHSLQFPSQPVLRGGCSLGWLVARFFRPEAGARRLQVQAVRRYQSLEGGSQGRHDSRARRDRSGWQDSHRDRH